MINWRVRLKNRIFWVSVIPMLALLISQVCSLVGIEIDLSGLSDQLIGIVGTVFMILALLGIVVDPTTAGVSDSTQALNYDEPREG